MGKHLQKVKEMLAGEHKSQKQKYFSFAPDNSGQREIGSTWVEADKTGNVYTCTQEDGYVTRVKKIQPKYISKGYTNCLKENCSAENSQVNNKLKIKTGRCIECQTRFEDDLRIAGTYEQYEKEKILDRATGIFKDSDEFFKEHILTVREKGYTEEIQSDGTIKKIDIDISSLDKMIEDYEQFKREVIESI